MFENLSTDVNTTCWWA